MLDRIDFKRLFLGKIGLCGAFHIAGTGNALGKTQFPGQRRTVLPSPASIAAFRTAG